MPRRSPYQVILSAEERTRLEALSRRYSAPYRDVIRAKIVLLAAEGWEKVHCRTPGYAPADRPQMEAALRGRGLAGSGRTPPPGSSPAFFPHT